MAKSIKNSPHAEINMIPFLDVLLVLVAVLLLLTPFMAKSINVDLPSAVTGAVMTQDTSISLEVKEDGTVWFEGTRVSDWDALNTAMDGATAAKVFADKNAPFVAVVSVMDKLAAHDIHNIQFPVKD